MDLNMEKMNEKLNKLGVDVMSIQIKLAVVDRVMNKQKEIENDIEEGKQNQKKLSLEMKNVLVKVDNVNDKVETFTALLEKTRSTVAKKIKKVKTEIEELNNSTRSSFEQQENANKSLSLKLNKNEAKMKEMEDQVVVMEMVRQEMNERVETMGKFVIKNEKRLLRINEQVEECKQMTLDTDRKVMQSALAMGQNLHLKPEVEDKVFEKLNSKINILSLENEKLLVNQKIQQLQVFEDKNKFLQMQKLIYQGNPIGFDSNNYYVTHRDQVDYKWKITDLNAIENVEHESPVFELKDHGINAQAKLHYVSKTPTLEIKFFNLENSKKLIKILPKIYFVLKNQSNTNNLLLKLNYSYMDQQPIQFDSYYNLRASNLKLEFPNFVSNISIEIDIFTVPPSMTQQIYSYNGILYWLIENYNGRIPNGHQPARNSTWPCESPYFYTSACEYRVQCIMHFDMSQTQSHVQAHYSNMVALNIYGPIAFEKAMSYVLLTAEIVFLPGDLDSLLFNTHYHRTKITIFNVKNPKAHVFGNFEGDIQKNNRSSITMKCNRNISEFIENGSLFYKVCVELYKEPPK